MYVGTTDTLIATVLPSNATNKDITWSLSGNYATVNDGVVTGVSLGVTTLTVTTVDGSFKATCQVTVTELQAVLINFNNATSYSIAGLITQFASVIGLDLTDYNALPPDDKSQVQYAVLNYPMIFTATEQIKAAFDEAIAVQIINTSSIETVGNALVKFAGILGLDLTAYDALTDKTVVHAYMMQGPFTSADEIQMVFDTAVANIPAAEAALAAINAAAADTIGAILASNAALLGLDMWDYDNYADKAALDAALASQDFANQYEIYQAILTFIYG